jgi:sugar phosphate isomerase/epimerase
MSIPIGLQLYTVREALKQDFPGVIRRIAETGYIGVETAGAALESTTVNDAARLFRDLGLVVTSAHGDLPLGSKKNQVLDMLGEFHCKRIICPWTPPEKFQTLDGIKSVCDELNEAAAAAQGDGVTVLYHNHWFEYEMLDGRRASQIMLEHLSPAVQLEIDTYWVQVGGDDPARVVKDLGKRAPLLHIKDGPAENKDQPMVAVGDGVLDWEAIISAAQGSAEWLIVELDRCATDMLEAVTKSYSYLVKKGFARGNKS